MASDSITEEIRGIRRSLAEEFGNDLDLILADLRRREAEDGRKYISLPARHASQIAEDQSDTPSREDEFRAKP